MFLSPTRNKNKATSKCQNRFKKTEKKTSKRTIKVIYRNFCVTKFFGMYKANTLHFSY